MVAEPAQIAGLGQDRQGVDRTDTGDHAQELIIAVRRQRVMGDPLDLYETACASIALPIDEDSTAVTMFRMVISQARTLIQQRNEIEPIPGIMRRS